MSLGMRGAEETPLGLTHTGPRKAERDRVLDRTRGEQGLLLDISGPGRGLVAHDLGGAEVRTGRGQEGHVGCHVWPGCRGPQGL